MEHTKGPWRAIKCDNGEWCIRTMDKNPLSAIAWTSATGPLFDEQTLENNARLLAASPELLATCKFILAVLSQNALYPSDIAAMKLHCGEAIAKAEGR